MRVTNLLLPLLFASACAAPPPAAPVARLLAALRDEMLRQAQTGRVEPTVLVLARDGSIDGIGCDPGWGPGVPFPPDDMLLRMAERGGFELFAWAGVDERPRQPVTALRAVVFDRERVRAETTIELPRAVDCRVPPPSSR